MDDDGISYGVFLVAVIFGCDEVLPLLPSTSFVVSPQVKPLFLDGPPVSFSAAVGHLPAELGLQALLVGVE